MNRINISQAIVVEGRDDVDAVQKAVDTLIIPTHGFGITSETWGVIEKAYNSKGIIVLTDPDFSGEEIRRKLNERFPAAINAYIAVKDAIAGDDIGVENSQPEIIANAITQAIKNVEHIAMADDDYKPITMSDLCQLGLSGGEGASDRRIRLCKQLGIGYGNSKALINKLTHWKIGIKELEQAITEIEK